MTSSELKEIRLSLGYSQREMAEKIGYAPDSYESMEQGRRAVSKRAELLVKALQSRA